jgi:hypothetical protein
MPPKKAVVAVERAGAPPVPAGRLPPWLQIVLVLIISFTASTGLYTVGSIFTRYELSSVSRSVNETWEVLLFPAWRIVELAVGWFARYDGKKHNLIAYNIDL